MQTGRSGRVTRPGRPARTPERAVAGSDCAAAFQAMARDCLAQMQAACSGTIAGHAEALHQMRVAISRLRATIAFFAPMTSDAAWRKLKKELAWLYAILGDARDADVMSALRRRKRYREWAAQIGTHDDSEDREIHRRVVAAIRSKRFRRLLDALLGWVELGPWLTRRDNDGPRMRAEPLRAYSQCKLERWRMRLIRKGHGLATMDGKLRHRLRIKVKRYRYVLEALGETCPPGTRSKLRHLHKPAKRLQRSLGDLRDLQRLRAGASERPPGYRKQKKELLAAARAALHDIERPRSLPPF